MSEVLGTVAALSAPLLMTFGFILWDAHWKGSAFALNLFKCVTASFGFLLLVFLTRLDAPFSTFTLADTLFLILSAFIGIVVGDLLWLEALQLIGARRVIVVDTLKPFCAALFGYLLLGESVNWFTGLGMLLTMTGVLFVSLEKENDPTGPSPSTITTESGGPTSGGVGHSHESGDVLLAAVEIKEIEINLEAKLAAADDVSKSKKIPLSRLQKGYAMAAANIFLDTYGAVLTKQYGSHLNSWEINFTRFGSSAVMLAFMGVCMKYWRTRPSKAVGYRVFPVMPRIAWLKVLCGVLLVTFLNPGLQVYALFQISLGIALTLSSVTPLYALPLTFLLKKEAITLRATLWTVVAVAGVVILVILG